MKNSVLLQMMFDRTAEEYFVAAVVEAALALLLCSLTKIIVVGQQVIAEEYCFAP